MTGANTTGCPLCNLPFTWKFGERPRKQCSKCNKAVCKKCCSQKFVLTELSTTHAKRVCNACARGGATNVDLDQETLRMFTGVVKVPPRPPSGEARGAPSRPTSTTSDSVATSTTTAPPRRPSLQPPSPSDVASTARASSTSSSSMEGQSDTLQRPLSRPALPMGLMKDIQKGKELVAVDTALVQSQDTTTTSTTTPATTASPASNRPPSNRSAEPQLTLQEQLAAATRRRSREQAGAASCTTATTHLPESGLVPPPIRRPSSNAPPPVPPANRRPSHPSRPTSISNSNSGGDVDSKPPTRLPMNLLGDIHNGIVLKQTSRGAEEDSPTTTTAPPTKASPSPTTRVNQPGSASPMSINDAIKARFGKGKTQDTNNQIASTPPPMIAKNSGLRAPASQPQTRRPSMSQGGGSKGQQVGGEVSVTNRPKMPMNLLADIQKGKMD